MNAHIFVSSADSKYFPLLAEWLHSLRRTDFGRGIDIGILDAGMTAAQLNYLRASGCIVRETEWPKSLSPRRTKGRDYLKACICRPFLPDYFPGYETITWMDADTWVQREDVLPAFIASAQKGNIALTAQVDRAYPRQIRVKWLGPFPAKISGFYISNARKSLGWKTAKKLYPYSVLLAGMFSLRADAPHWKRWQEIMLGALDKGNIFTAEQLSLGVLCHLESYPHDIFPGWMHWLCNYPTLWDEGRQAFVEPFTPHNVLGVLHLSGVDEMRANRAHLADFKTINGGLVRKSFRYPYLDGESVLETP